MPQSADRKCVEKRERQARDRLLRHYRDIGAPAIAAALDVVRAVQESCAEDPAGELRDSTRGFPRRDDHAA
ncbi:hypothetical protein WOC76_18255 [Methylocystis sp. IM3]|uniref:hypothetical protein n=1 Tax=unclassified Methylocystis TaxID=2625913 RepID=UPI0030F8EB0B